MNITRRDEIAALLASYSAVIDDNRLEQWPEFFSEHCLYRVTNRRDFERGLQHGAIWANTRGMLTDRVSALREANVFEDHVYRHINGSFRIIEETEHEASVSSNFMVIRTMLNGEMSVFAAGVYEDRIEFHRTGAVFNQRIVICDSQRFDTLLAIPL
jgi:3-phenylpropionate/cinnamic acid dioxygenase small subunit